MNCIASYMSTRLGAQCNEQLATSSQLFARHQVEGIYCITPETCIAPFIRVNGLYAQYKYNTQYKMHSITRHRILLCDRRWRRVNVFRQQSTGFVNQFEWHTVNIATISFVHMFDRKQSQMDQPQPSTPVQSFYKGQTIFITGGTGFMGKVSTHSYHVNQK